MDIFQCVNLLMYFQGVGIRENFVALFADICMGFQVCLQIIRTVQPYVVTKICISSPKHGTGFK